MRCARFGLVLDKDVSPPVLLDPRTRRSQANTELEETGRFLQETLKAERTC